MAESKPLLLEVGDAPQAWFAGARQTDDGSMPQCIAHRGYKDVFPENTMGAFKGAVEVGAHALETDVHLSKDGVVVLSHDATLKRCYGQPDKVADCDWSYLSTLKTLRAPHESMPRLSDLLEYLASPDVDDRMWVLIDVKRDDDAKEMMRLLAETINTVTPSRPWRERIILGCWTAQYVKLSTEYLPGFPIAYIGFSLLYAQQFFRIPNVCFNMRHEVLVGYWGRLFLREAKIHHRPVFVWTVNDVEDMQWSIRTEVAGVITDDPKKFLEVCKDYDRTAPVPRTTWRQTAKMIWINVLASVFHIMFYGFSGILYTSIKPQQRGL